MHFDDGTNPWIQTENYIKVFDFGPYSGYGGSSIPSSSLILVTSILILDIFILRNYEFL